MSTHHSFLWPNSHPGHCPSTVSTLLKCSLLRQKLCAGRHFERQIKSHHQILLSGDPPVCLRNHSNLVRIVSYVQCFSVFPFVGRSCTSQPEQGLHVTRKLWGLGGEFLHSLVTRWLENRKKLTHPSDVTLLHVCVSFIHVVFSSSALVCLLLCSKTISHGVFKESGIHWEVDSAMWCESQKVIPETAARLLQTFPLPPSSFPSSLPVWKRREIRVM